MVAVSLKPPATVAPPRKLATGVVLFVFCLACVVWTYGSTAIDYQSLDIQVPQILTQVLTEKATEKESQHEQCPITSIATLSKEELEPKAGSRHMVGPPQGGKLTLLCCKTTKGHFSALLHHSWAPTGVARLVEMIESGYFSTKIPFFRCTDACQFGLSGDPEATKRFNSRLQDEPMWLPPGKDHRKNENGVKRYPEGVWTYAGAGPNTRSNQFVITLKPNPYMGGGSPWEVPMGEFVGKESFAVLPLLYNGYGEKGPGQGLLRQEGNSERVQKEWPLMDYILSCDVIDEAEGSPQPPSK
jgi:cyclophilin family peptidyl-prolyl cis-trans isomerase